MDDTLTRREWLRMAAAAVGAAPFLQGEEVVGVDAAVEARAVAAQPARGHALVSKVDKVFGVPTFTLDGKPYTVPVFETYAPEFKYFKQFADTGVKVFSFNTNAARCDHGHSKPTWPAPDRWDYSELDERVRRVLAATPDALILPRVYIGTPDWWLEKHPDEMEVLHDGRLIPRGYSLSVPKNRPFPSVASEKWRQDMGYGLQHLIEYIQSSDYASRIFGYFLTGLKTEEWYHWGVNLDQFQLFGYSPQMVKAFRRWLKEKYGTAANLRAAWNHSTVDFETATVPSRDERFDRNQGTFRDPSRKMNVIDFYVFYNEVIPDTVDYFAAIARKATQGTKVLGAFYAYMYEFDGDPEFGHNALGKLNESPHLDFIFVTASYNARQLGSGGDYLRAPSFSVQLHDKLWYHDNDVASHKSEEVFARRNFDEATKTRLRDVLAVTKTAEETIGMYRRSAGFALCTGSFESYFDLHGGYYDDPELMAEVARLNRMFERVKDYDRSSNSEILIVSDENSCSYCTFKNEMLAQSLMQTQWQLIKVGAPTDHVLVDDLALLDMDRYKLVVFLNTYNLSDSQRDLIERKVKGGNRTVLWCYAPGLFNGTATGNDLMRAVTGMKIVASTDESLVAPRIAIAESASGLSAALRKAGQQLMGPNRPLCKLISVEDGDAVSLGTLPGTTRTTLAMKRMGHWISVYSITPTLTAAFYRELARQAGVHIYNDRDDTFYANRSYVTLHANGAGQREIRFPRACDLYDAVTERQLAARTRNFPRDFKHGETVILRWH